MKLLFAGDFFYDYEYLADDLLELANWVHQEEYQLILNLEGGIYSSSNPIKKRGCHLHQSDKTIEMMKALNVVGVCLSNNHIMDFGSETLQKTLGVLDVNGIAHTGAGQNLEAALQPMILGNGRERTIILNFGWDVEETVYATDNDAGCAPRKEPLILKRICEMKEKESDAKIVVVMHWGFELNPLPQPLDVKLAHDMIEAGADLIIGHHPHNIQPFEIYQGKPIYYSLGNFYFGGHRSSFSRRKFQGQVENLCDYGALVEFDCQTGVTSHENLILYSRSDNSSGRISNQGMLMSDISGEDFFSAAYEERAKACSLNTTPVLTLDSRTNQSKLRKLFFAYRIASLIKGVRKTRMGEAVYQRAKRIYKRMGL